MNARVYDSEIGRFLSADTMIQDPYDTQAYNRYSYVRNNPMIFTDPTGHSWLSKIWKKAKRWVKKHVRTIAAIAAAAIIAVVAPPLLPAALGQLGTSVAVGALAGAASGAIQTKSLKGALKGALFGAVGVVAAVGVVNVTAKVFSNVVSKAGAHSANFINSGINKVTMFKAAAHGIARGIIQTAQGGSFKAGFMSGVSSGFDVGTSAMGGNTVGGFVARTVTMGVVGGTASALGGGKFSNGAMSGAFTHMFNAELGKNMVSKDVDYKRARAATKAFRDKHPDNFNVLLHGNSREVIGPDNYYTNDTPESLYSLLVDGGWNGKTGVNLFVCNVGSGNNSLAQQFSDTYGVEVYAPNGYYRVPPVYGNGYVTQSNSFPLYLFSSGSMVRF